MVRLYEYKGKELLKTVKIPIPEGYAASTPEAVKKAAEQIGKPVVIKAQIFATGRFKAGGIKFADTPEEAENVAKALIGSEVKGMPVNEVLVEELRCVMHATRPASFATAQRAMARRPDVSPLLDEMDLPTLVICGASDAITPPAEMRSLAAAIPTATYTEIPAAGHLAPREQPQPVNAAIRQLIGQLE